MSRAGRAALAALLIAALVGLSFQIVTIRAANDDGLMGQCAERVLGGELPHRDFDEPYTGGLSYFYAGLFEVLGVQAWVPRAAVALMGLLVVLATWSLAARAVGPVMAAVLAAVALAWGPMQYLAPVPTWWNVALALLGMWAMLRHTDTGLRRWLVLAGALGGLSVLAKVSGVFQLAAGLLYLVHAEVAGSPAAAEGEARRGALLPGVVALGVAAVLGTIALTHREHAVLAECVYYVTPVVAVSLALAAVEARLGVGAPGPRLRRLAALVSPFAAGAAAPIAAFASMYAARGALGDLVRGVLVLPRRRIEFASSPIVPELAAAGALVALALLVAPPRRVRPLARSLTAAAAIVAVAAALGGRTTAAQVETFALAQALFPALAVAGALQVARGEGTAASLLAALTLTFLQLVQFPFSHPFYVGYVVPPALVAGACIVSRADPVVRPIFAVLAGFLLVHGVASVATRDPTLWPVEEWGRWAPAPAVRLTSLPRARWVRLTVKEASVLEATLALADRVTAEGDWIHSGPDSPHVPFFLGRREAARRAYDFFDEEFSTPAAAAALDQRLAERDVRFVVLTRGAFSGVPGPDLVRVMSARFPRAQIVPPFLVRWR